MILVDGTSSSGKSTICTYFTKFNFKCFQIDNYNLLNNSIIEELKKMQNKYNELEKILSEKPTEIMINDALKTKRNFLLDDILQKDIIDYFKKKKIYDKLFIIVVYTNLTDIARNLESRRKKGDIRGVFAFDQFAERYIKTSENDPNKIEQINRKNFIKLLLKYFKYEFKNKNHLIEFANEIFQKMNINDDKYNWIKLRLEFKYDYLLITTGKTKEDIFKELRDRIII